MTKGRIEASTSSHDQHVSREGTKSHNIPVHSDYQNDTNAGKIQDVLEKATVKSTTNDFIPSDSRDVANNSTMDSRGLHNKGNRVSYASLFKKNRMANANYKLEFMETGTGILKFEIEDIDSIEKTYGICLLGYIISGKPPTAALFDLVRRWGPDIRFQTHESGWIIFTFPTTEVRDRILNGGSYLVFGFHLFLKEMPRCFRFREEDMNSIPVWVQIHGLPPDCWNANILSKLASRVGNLIHMDMLTHERKRVKFARVLVEVQTTKQKITEIDVELPIGVVVVKFIYEQDIKYCVKCNKAGHATVDCDNAYKVADITGEMNPNTTKLRSTSRRNRYSHAPTRNASATTANVKQMEELRLNEGTTVENNMPDTVPNDQIIEVAIEPMQVDKGKRIMDTNDTNTVGTSKVADCEKDGFQTVVNKKKNKKKKKGKIVEEKQLGKNKEMTVFFEDLDDNIARVIQNK